MRRKSEAAQALVEFALMAPVILFCALGFIEAGFLVNAKGDLDRRTMLVAEWAASHPGDDSWKSVAAKHLKGCEVTVDDHGRPGIVTAGATCTYHPVATSNLWDGLPISSEQSAAVRYTVEPEPTPSPDPSPSPS